MPIHTYTYGRRRGGIQKNLARIVDSSSGIASSTTPLAPSFFVSLYPPGSNSFLAKLYAPPLEPKVLLSSLLVTSDTAPLTQLRYSDKDL